MAYAALLLDLDGTLLDTAADFHRVINQLLAQEGRPGMDYDALRRVVSHGARAMVATGFAIDEHHADFARLRQAFLDIYATHYAVDTHLFAGFEEVLQYCDDHNIPWGIVTNKPLAFAQPLWQALQLPYRLGCLICPDHVRQAKPDPEPMHLAARQLNIPSEYCLYIGDHLRDIQAGHAAHMDTAVAHWGYIAEDDNTEHWGATHHLNDPREILALLQ